MKLWSIVAFHFKPGNKNPFRTHAAHRNLIAEIGLRFLCEYETTIVIIIVVEMHFIDFHRCDRLTDMSGIEMKKKNLPKNSL